MPWNDVRLQDIRHFSDQAHKILMRRRNYSPLILIAALALTGCGGGGSKPYVQTGGGSGPARANAGASGQPVYKVGSPYQIQGTWYYPAEDFSYEESGIASWYGEDFHGKSTANGEVFNLNELTAAHRTLPMPSIVQVTNLDNGRVLQLRVNDRGPFARGRILDVSRRAAQLLGFENGGTAKVRVKILVPESMQAASLMRRNGGGEVDTAVADVPKAAPRDRVVSEAAPPLPGTRMASNQSAPPPPPPPRPVLNTQLPGATTLGTQPLPQARQAPASAPTATPPQVQALLDSPGSTPAVIAPKLPEKVAVVPVKKTQIYIQAGAFSQADNAMRTKGRLDSFGATQVSGVTVNGVNLYRVRVGPLPSVDEADRLLARIVDSGLGEAKIIVD